MKNLYKNILIGGLLWLLLGIIATTIIRSNYIKDAVILTLLWAGLGMGWNILGGFAGQLSIGHAAFFGTGAYVSALLFINFGLSPWVGMLVAAIFNGIIAAIVGLITLRLKGPFFVLSTLAITEVFRILVIFFRSVTKGSIGIYLPLDFGFYNMIWASKNPYIFVTLVYSALVYMLCYGIENKKIGYYLKAIKENPVSAEALGINVTIMKVVATVISAFIVSIGGSIYAQYMLYIEPQTVFGSTWSIQMALIAIVGGLATSSGPIIGAFLLIPLNTFFRGALCEYSGLCGFVYGWVLLGVILFMREGILPSTLSVWKNFKKEKIKQIIQ